MTSTLPPAIFQQLVQFIQPFMIDPDEREAWITQAFYLREPRIFQNLDRYGAPMPFTVKCVKFLIDSECLVDPKREHAASVLLDTLRMGCGPDKHKQIDSLIGVLDDVCHDPVPPVTASPNVPAPTPSDPALQTIDTPLDKRIPTVFISYSHADTEFAKKLIADLQQAGHAVWVDVSSLKGGDQWLRAIAEGIINSYAFVLVATKQSLKSQWVQDEILWAKQRNKRILTVLLEDVTNEIGFFPLVNYQGIKFYDADYAAATQALLRGLPAPRLEGSDTVPVDAPPRQISPRELELQYLERLNLENWLATIKRVEQYQTMAGTAQTKARDSSLLMTQKYKFLGDLLGEESRPEAAREQREYTDIIQAIREIKRAVLLGEPGAGKTTTLWRLAKDLFDTAMADPKAPIPVLVRLGKWMNPDEPLTAFIQHELGELGVHLGKLIADKRVVLLLDGLNEIPLAQRKAGKDEQVKAFIETAFKANPDLIGVISCRERDYTLDLGFDKIEVAPLDPLRIREFVTRYLDPVKGIGTGETMFWRLAGSPMRARYDEFCEGMLAADMPNWELQLWLSPVPPSSVAEWRWELWLRQRENSAGLLTLAKNPYMLTMMTDIYRESGTLPDNRGELFTQFVDELIGREKRTNERMAGRESALTAALARLAYVMQTRRSADKSADDISTALPIAEIRPALLDDDLLYLGGSTSVLSVGEAVRFSHQLLQEYFAALYMMLEIKAGRLNATDLWKPANWWEPTGWEEAAILLVGMFPEHIDWVATANPELAAQCVARSGAGLAWSVLAKYQAEWLPRLTDFEREPNPIARAAIGRALGLADLDNRPGVGLRADGLPDLVWCEVPAGVFIYGLEGEKRTLPTFWMSQYQITYKQFQSFINAPDGFSNLQWWDGLHTDGLDQQGGLGDQAFKFWNHPRETVSWYEAMAFCRWLSVKLGCEITLPTEEQWEKAARSTNGRFYSYGFNEEQDVIMANFGFDRTKGNTMETGINKTSAVGIFSDSAPPYGLYDMVGNVVEWMLDTRGDKINRSVRGGSYQNSSLISLAVYNTNAYPAHIRLGFIGFRLVVVDSRPPSLPH